MRAIKILKKIYSVLVLIKNLLIRKQNYTLTFYRKEFGLWYYKFKGWGFDEENLMMVSGADKLCDYLNDQNDDEITVKIKASRKPIQDIKHSAWAEYKGEDLSNYKTFKDKYLYGRYYELLDKTNREELTKFWVCPVTLFVLGRYPNYIYIHKL